jgi:hypothetical protein
MRSDVLSSHLDVIGNLHHASVVHWRLSTKLSSSICIHESSSGMPQSLEIALHTLLFNLSGEHSLHLSDVEFQLMDVEDDIMTYIEISLVYWNKQSS